MKTITEQELISIIQHGLLATGIVDEDSCQDILMYFQIEDGEIQKVNLILEDKNNTPLFNNHIKKH